MISRQLTPLPAGRPPCTVTTTGQKEPRCRKAADFEVTAPGSQARQSCGDHLARVVRQMAYYAGTGAEFTVRFAEAGG